MSCYHWSVLGMALVFICSCNVRSQNVEEKINRIQGHISTEGFTPLNLTNKEEMRKAELIAGYGLNDKNDKTEEKFYEVFVKIFNASGKSNADVPTTYDVINCFFFIATSDCETTDKKNSSTIKKECHVGLEPSCAVCETTYIYETGNFNGVCGVSDTTTCIEAGITVKSTTKLPTTENPTEPQTKASVSLKSSSTPVLTTQKSHKIESHRKILLLPFAVWSVSFLV